MRKKHLAKSILLLSLTAILISSCAGTFPAKEKVAAMSDEDATKLLLNKTQQEVQKHWGEPDSFFSGFYGDIYTVGDKCIGVYYHADSRQVYHVACWTRKVPEQEIEGNMRSYAKMNDGTWMCDGYTYAYRLEITGRMPNAARDSTFIYLSNIEEITFEQAFKASGVSSDLDDYFSPEEAVLVEMY